MQFAVAYASIIFLEKKSNAVSSLHRLCIASTSCFRSYIAAKKLRNMKIITLKLLMANKRASLWEKRLFATAQLISAFVFDIRIVQFLQAFSHLLWLYSSVCVGLGRKPRRPVFSQRGSNTGSIFFQWYETITIYNKPLWHYTDYFHSCKYDNLQMKQTDLSLIFAQLIEHGYTWDPPQYRLSATVLTITHNLWLWKKGKTDNNNNNNNNNYLHIPVCLKTY